MARIIHGGRLSLSLSIISMSVAVAIGACIGAVAGYYGGRVDDVLMRLMDILLAIPPMLMSISIVAALGQSMVNLLIALAIAYIPVFARVIRSTILSIKGQEFVEAARACGTSNARIILRHIIPNAIGPIIVEATLTMGAAILIISSLSFMGLGIEPPAPEWGTMLYEGRDVIRNDPYLVIFPGGGDRAGRHVPQPAGRRAARRPRPAAEELRRCAMSEAFAGDQRPRGGISHRRGDVHALNGITLSLDKGETLGLVGETGAGKTTTALSIMRLLPKRIGEVKNGEIRFEGQNLLEKTEAEMRLIRGESISMIFQDPMTSLNPVIRVGDQILEALELHRPDMSRAEQAKKVDEMLEMVGIPAARKREYPAPVLRRHEAAGGHRHRAGAASRSC